jgi:hypothetical protein
MGPCVFGATGIAAPAVFHGDGFDASSHEIPVTCERLATALPRIAIKIAAARADVELITGLHAST